MNAFWKYIILLLTFATAILTASAQTSNDADIYVATGSTMEVKGNLTNNGGYIWNDGDLIIRDSLLNHAGTVRGDGNFALGGNWVNNDAFLADESSVRFTGTGATNIVSGGDTFNTIYFNKTNGTLITLQGNLYVTDSLVWENGNIVTSAGDTVFFLNTAPAALTGYSNAGYIDGSLSRKMGTGNSYFYPVASGTLGAADYFPADLRNVSVSGNPVVNARFAENFTGTKPLSVSGEGPYDSMATDGIWVVKPVSGTSGTESFTAALGIENFTNLQDNKFGVLRRDIGSTAAADWSADGSLPSRNSTGRLASDDYALRSSVTGFDGEYGIGLSDDTIDVQGIVISIKVFLEAAYSNGSMTTALNTSGFLPNAQPYNISPWSYSGAESIQSIPNSDVVDWVLIELRTGTAASTIVERKACFIKKDGSVVGLDGSSLPEFTSSSGNYYVVVRHRNHLAVMSSSALALNNSSSLYNFSTAQNMAYGSNSMSQLSSGVFGMTSGDANSSGVVNSTDLLSIKLNSGKSGYFSFDVNLNGVINSTDILKAKQTSGKSTQVPN